MGNCYNHLTWDKRITIANFLKINMKIKDISKVLGVHNSTIYRELKRGQYEHLNDNLTTEIRYSPDIAHKKYQENLKNKGRELKIGNDIALANYIENKIINEKLSPKAVLLHIKNANLKFSTSVCFRTIYNYIDNDVFYRLTNKDLVIKRNRRKRKNKVKKRSKVMGNTIENRPKHIDLRQEFGHWEMDCVLGKREKGKVLLVLTERKTRFELIILMDSQTANCVVTAISEIEKNLGFRKFKKIFKTITVDNGSEFANSIEIERSIISKKNRTTVYYCHPHASWERGSNENNNRLIRRWFPKNTSFKTLNDEKVKFVQNWLNDYPRGIFNGNTAKDKLMIELDLLKINIIDKL